MNENKTQYNKVTTDGYIESKNLEFRKWVEEHSLFNILSYMNINDSVLDVACGNGHYTRKIAERSLVEVIGVDNSIDMINAANAIEFPRCAYYLDDVISMRRSAFTHVVANYLLNYAETENELDLYVRSLYKVTAEGGCVVGINDNPFSPCGPATDYTSGLLEKYGIDRDPGEYGKVYWYFYDDGGHKTRITNFYHPPSVYCAAFAKAGFKSFNFIPVKLSPAWPGDGAYWDDFFVNPPIIGFRAFR